MGSPQHRELVSESWVQTLNVLLELSQLLELLGPNLACLPTLSAMHRSCCGTLRPACGCSRPRRGPAMRSAHALTLHRSLAALVSRSFGAGLAAGSRVRGDEKVHHESMCSRIGLVKAYMLRWYVVLKLF